MPPRPPLPLLSSNSLVYLWRGVIGGAAAGEMMEAPARHLQSHLVRIKSLDCAWVVVGCSDMCALAGKLQPTQQCLYSTCVVIKSMLKRMETLSSLLWFCYSTLSNKAIKAKKNKNLTLHSLWLSASIVKIVYWLTVNSQSAVIVSGSLFTQKMWGSFPNL